MGLGYNWSCLTANVGRIMSACLLERDCGKLLQMEVDALIAEFDEGLATLLVE